MTTKKLQKVTSWNHGGISNHFLSSQWWFDPNFNDILLFYCKAQFFWSIFQTIPWYSWILKCFVLSVLEGEINGIHLLELWIPMAKLAETALIMNTIDFSFQNTQNKTFENATIPWYSLKNWPEKLGFSLYLDIVQK